MMLTVHMIFMSVGSMSWATIQSQAGAPYFYCLKTSANYQPDLNLSFFFLRAAPGDNLLLL